MLPQTVLEGRGGARGGGGGGGGVKAGRYGYLMSSSVMCLLPS